MKAGDALETGTQIRLGLAEEGVGYAVDDNNMALISEEMKMAAEDAKAKIIAGDIDVVSYYANDSCPVLDF